MGVTSEAEQQYREALRLQLARRFAEERKANERAGRYPFECRWLAVDEIVELQNQLKKADTSASIELAALLVMLLAGFFLLALLGYLIVR